LKYNLKLLIIQAQFLALLRSIDGLITQPFTHVCVRERLVAKRELSNQTLYYKAESLPKISLEIGLKDFYFSIS